LVVGVLVAGAAVAVLASSGAARSAAPAGMLLACPKDPRTAPIGRIYGASRGTTWCNDGATATATLAGKTHAFSGGVCFRDSVGLHVGIGTSIEGKRKASDPPGFALNDFPPGGIVKDGAYFGLTKAGKVVAWSWGDVKLTGGKGSAPKGSFSGVMPTLAGGKLTRVAAMGTFACKRVLQVPG
jgi:hypothetical protein